MPTVDDLSQSNFITQRDVEPPVFVTITKWDKQNVAKDGAEPEYRYCLHFDKLEKPMTLNKTNGLIISEIAGSADFDDWIGKNIVLYRDPNIMFAGQRKGGIRVRAPKEGYTPPEREPQQDVPDDDIPF